MLAVGMRLGPYEILAPLGRGGMGEVYRAKDIRLGREIAVKVVPEQLAEDPQRLARFEREAKAVAVLAHPNILVLYDIGREQGIPYAVTELLEGQTLRDRLARRSMPVPISSPWAASCMNWWRGRGRLRAHRPRIQRRPF